MWSHVESLPSVVLLRTFKCDQSPIKFLFQAKTPLDNLTLHFCSSLIEHSEVCLPRIQCFCSRGNLLHTEESKWYRNPWISLSHLCTQWEKAHWIKYHAHLCPKTQHVPRTCALMFHLSRPLGRPWHTFLSPDNSQLPVHNLPMYLPEQTIQWPRHKP